MSTIWKDIPFFTNYQLSSLGEVRRKSGTDEYGNLVLGYLFKEKWGKVTLVDDNGISMLVDIRKLYKELFQNVKNKK